ncbi:D-alanyl-D-alanine carboxypeptidase [Sphaerisporangium krabiense]|uniref:D-alanyl-D-alanine carboxypeptidase (Penicillin-binding protein 5/6) n=1 Tax=Sphaerisporangium krabiense TaxID=763782 RepID=A0A7W8Z2C8_9ACTN|nr:D-alanyl-D-alanine carboxypeptidase family protein [Sphaerisporangium krabiense]MBB5626105.1 D-alanyl-D-alanine carboxypeptidase (penicillin-binding protein 5/6) [Sphaerisporangium krabiense]GII64910.1 D-alanyl-D-alanine carboxypeptidase [Sphaerisporangium krabiense]
MLATSALVSGLSSPAIARSAPTAVLASTERRAPEVFGRAVYLMDAANGKSLLDENAADRMPIASLTKVMTAYLVLSEAKPADTVQIAQQDADYAEAGGGTTADLRPGDRIPVGELLYGLMLPSGADAAHALARHYGPGVDGFVRKMNATAHRLGLRDTLYVNADGLPTSNGDGYSTARDQARLAAIALRDERFRTVTATRSHSLAESAEHRSYTWTNTNRIAGDPGVLGVKTGFTNDAGFCLTFAADRDGRRLVGVILGEEVSSRRFVTAESLLDWGGDRGGDTARDQV